MISLCLTSETGFACAAKVVNFIDTDSVVETWIADAFVVIQLTRCA